MHRTEKRLPTGTGNRSSTNAFDRLPYGSRPNAISMTHTLLRETQSDAAVHGPLRSRRIDRYRGKFVAEPLGTDTVCLHSVLYENGFDILGPFSGNPVIDGTGS